MLGWFKKKAAKPTYVIEHYPITDIWCVRHKGGWLSDIFGTGMLEIRFLGVAKKYNTKADAERAMNSHNEQQYKKNVQEYEYYD